MLSPRWMLWCKKDQGLGLTGCICPSPTYRKQPGHLHPVTTPDARASGGLILPQIHQLTQDSRAETFTLCLRRGWGDGIGEGDGSRMLWPSMGCSSPR